ncbi:MAG: response regulator [Thermodesulfovibrionales bacterium]|nr:response regulator [Thermodesulfovibrionales bacterium]
MLRKKDRILFSTDVFINGIMKAHCLDISEGGMYIATPTEFIPGATVDIAFRIFDKDFKIKAKIQHYEQGIGIGVKFLSPPPELIDAIHRLREKKLAAITGRRTVLLIDDSSQSRAIYKSKLQNDGFMVIEAKDGIEALKMMQETRPDLIILDLWMEGLDGFKLMQIMKLNPELKDIPVIVLSARVIPADVDKALSLGAREFLPKMTTTPAKLAERVRSYFV